MAASKKKAASNKTASRKPAARKAPPKKTLPKRAAAKKGAAKKPARLAKAPAKAAKKPKKGSKPIKATRPARPSKPLAKASAKSARPAPKAPKKASPKTVKPAQKSLAPKAPAKASAKSARPAQKSTLPKAAAKAPTKASAAAPPTPVTPAPRVKRPAPPMAPPVAPVLKPTVSTGQKVVPAPLPPPVRHGAVDGQLFSAINYGLFAAINKTFGTFGQSVVKNASLRMLEYGYKKQWLPPKAKDPIKALNEFFGRLETMGYADRIQISKKDDKYVCEVTNLMDWDAIAELRELHYPLLPIFINEIILAFLDQYFSLIVAMQPVELAPEKRGLRIRFTTHSRAETIAPPITEHRPIHADLED